MVNNLMVIYDVVAQDCAEPWTAKRGSSDNPYGVAKRKFTDSVNEHLRKQKGLNMADYELRCVGVLDTETLQIEPKNDLVMCASDCPLYVDGDSVES